MHPLRQRNAIPREPSRRGGPADVVDGAELLDAESVDVVEPQKRPRATRQRQELLLEQLVDLVPARDLDEVALARNASTHVGSALRPGAPPSRDRASRSCRPSP